MKAWKIIIEYLGKKLEITVEAVNYPDAYIAADINYPGCVIKSIKEIK